MSVSVSAFARRMNDPSLTVSLLFRSILVTFRRIIQAYLTFCAGKTRHARREVFLLKLQYFLSFKYLYSNISEKGKQIINLLIIFNHFYSVISYRRVQKESGELSYIRFGHSLWSANQLPVFNSDLEQLAKFDKFIVWYFFQMYIALDIFRF